MTATIPIDREKKIILLQWLKQGFIDDRILDLQNEWEGSISDEELQNEIERLSRLLNNNQYASLQQNENTD